MQLSSGVLKLNKLLVILILSNLLIYYLFAYHLVRTDYLLLLCLYFSLFTLFYRSIISFKNNTEALTYIAFSFRAIFILAIPNLSQDFYRFIWDGRMILEGFNPYLYTPESFVSQGKFPIAEAQELFNGMGVLNASHFTNYPPLNQLCFAIAALFTNKSLLGSVVLMRLLVIVADFGTLHFGKKLLKKLKLPMHAIFWYVLNPFIIIEFTGNLHFEGVMIFFLVWSLYLMHMGKWPWAAIVLAFSISVKLIPLIFLPLFFQWFASSSLSNCTSTTPVNVSTNYGRDSSLLLRMTRLISFYAIVISVVLLLFTPFYSSEFINNYTETIALWFNNFEFNGSLYYIAREIGYCFRGYNEIAIIGKTIPYLILLFVLLLTFFRKNKTTQQLITAMLLVLSFYYFTATTVHPWYISTLLILSVFTHYKYPLVWSFIIILSYLAYLNTNKADKSENLWIIALEYLIVYGVFIWEIFIKNFQKRKSKSILKLD
ncbi:mannosyltransferase [Aestuariivivens sp. NBU2969]|uniref:mannosyltransferase n=1 Tax=Aestuariivivens sp. NBU2969 TaxID=2873267 RepID=UPI001CC0414F|nr:mannosyltransferase [Aestuariivivens sp. NBU2969]